MSAAGSGVCATCEHGEREHRGNGCLAIVESETGPALCPCVDYEPGRPAPRAGLRTLGEKGRAHERRMRKLRPAILARDGNRCRAGLPGCAGFASIAHHLHPSERGGEDVEANLIAVCAACHDWIHNIDPAGARRLGLLRSSG